MELRFLAMLLVLLVTLLCGSIPVLFHNTVRFVEKSLYFRWTASTSSYFCSLGLQIDFSFFDPSRNRCTILNTSLICIDFSIRCGVDPRYSKHHQHASTLRFVAESFFLCHVSWVTSIWTLQFFLSTSSVRRWVDPRYSKRH